MQTVEALPTTQTTAAPPDLEDHTVEYRIEVASENPMGDLAVINAGQALAAELDHHATNQGSVVVVDASTGTEVVAWRFPADDPPPAPDLDAQIDAAQARLEDVQDALEDLVLRRIGVTVLAKYPTAATLRLAIRDPDEVGMPYTWALEEDGLYDSDGQVLVEGELAELEDDLNNDLLILAAVDEVLPTMVIDLRADPPRLAAADINAFEDLKALHYGRADGRPLAPGRG
jgi:hypothetical protein